MTEATAHGTAQPQTAALSAAGAGVSGQTHQPWTPTSSMLPEPRASNTSSPSRFCKAAALCFPLRFTAASPSGTWLEAAIAHTEVPPTLARTPRSLPQTPPSPLVTGKERGRKGSEPGRRGCCRPRRPHFRARTGGWSQVGLGPGLVTLWVSQLLHLTTASYLVPTLNPRLSGGWEEAWPRGPRRGRGGPHLSPPVSNRSPPQVP